ncbi:hypothetical protein [Aliiglaciecola sp. LCG003]|uniref:hypothetical protein n=1 Tax=Aliiglaciecola sp. LCG003 TaxID=3053655 RepID=UPI002573A5B4|nr:hypothetical protein [Aliiglaciecola sp. LCG003]WJG10725.1 hypothetical protein QR722_06700 [Aliiglaciecola sp. LCG003]
MGSGQTKLRKAEIEKVEWEKSATVVFLDWYQQKFQVSYRFISHNQPSKPDVSCLIDHKPIDIEIAHLYGSEQEAMKILGRFLDSRTREALQKLRESCNTPQRFTHALNHILRNKASKSYQSEHTWLVIRNAHPAWNSDKIRKQIEHIDIPVSHPFEQIWVLGDLTAKSGAVKIYPVD